MRISDWSSDVCSSDLGLFRRSSRRLRGQMAAAEDIEEQARNHADAGRAEAPMPAVEFAQRAADEGRPKPADIDAEIIDIKGPGVARIRRLEKNPDLGRDGGPEKDVAENDPHQHSLKK